MLPPRDANTKHVRSGHLAFAVAAAVSIAVLAGCPQERPGTEREIPPQRIPPAVTVDPQPTSQGAATADGGVTRRP